MKRLLQRLCLLASLLLLAGCGDDEVVDYGDFIEVFATYMGEVEGRPELQYQAHDDSPMLTLHCDRLGVEDAKKGDRLFVRYTVLSRISDTEMNVRIDGATSVISDVVRQASAENLAKFNSTEIDVTSIWRTGNYLNVYAWVPYVGSKFTLQLIVDEAMLDDADIHARLIYDVLGQTPTFERKCLASFDMTNLWQRSTLQTLTIDVDDPTGSAVYRFEK